MRALGVIRRSTTSGSGRASAGASSPTIVHLTDDDSDDEIGLVDITTVPAVPLMPRRRPFKPKYFGLLQKSTVPLAIILLCTLGPLLHYNVWMVGWCSTVTPPVGALARSRCWPCPAHAVCVDSSGYNCHPMYRRGLFTACVRNTRAERAAEAMSVAMFTILAEARGNKLCGHSVPTMLSRAALIERATEQVCGSEPSECDDASIKAWQLFVDGTAGPIEPVHGGYTSHVHSFTFRCYVWVTLRDLLLEYLGYFIIAGIALVIALWLLIRRWKRERNDAQVKQWVDEVVTLLHHQASVSATPYIPVVHVRDTVAMGVSTSQWDQVLKCLSSDSRVSRFQKHINGLAQDVLEWKVPIGSPVRLSSLNTPRQFPPSPSAPSPRSPSLYPSLAHLTYSTPTKQ